jgi:hypothetical protein
VRTDYTADKVRRLAKRVKDAAQARRLLAIAAVLEQIVEIADSVEHELSGHGDGLALIHAIIGRHGYTGKQVHKIAVLVSMILIDRVNAELARLRAQR